MTAFSAALLLVSGCAGGPKGTRTLEQLGQLFPSPDLGPGDVVRIQMEALRLNDSDDRGIEIVFRFASPENRSFTGPLPRFAAMIKGPLYSPMLNHRGAAFGPPEVSGEEARQRVSVTAESGLVTEYLFTLSRQSGGEYAGCWMTEGVQTRSIREPADTSA